MSKFDYGSFCGGYDDLAVSKEKYSKEQAIEIAKIELDCDYHSKSDKTIFLAVGDGYVRHRAGRNEDNECCVGWWLEYTEHKRSCHCFVFHLTTDSNDKFQKEYEYIKLN